jgi:hypothetical protein
MNRSYSIGTALGAFVGNEAYGDTSMFQRQYQVQEVPQETRENASARKIAAIVPTLKVIETKTP